MKTVTLLVGTASLVLAGCAQLKPDPDHWSESSEQVSRVDKHSSFPAVRRTNFEAVNLIELVDPRGLAKGGPYKAAWDQSEKYESERKWGVQYDLVLAAFRESNDSADVKRQHRNSVQDRILGVSTSRCNVFKTFLRRQQADVNFALGSATTVAGVLGAVLPGATASRNLAGTAGIFSGVQAEYNSSYYSNLAAHVIIQGIEVHQNKLLATLVQERQSKSISDYSMEAAIRDAIHYDGTCSTVVGLTEASESIKETVNPGIPRAMQVISAVKAMAEVQQSGSFKDLAANGTLEKMTKLTEISASPLVVAQNTKSPSSSLEAQIANAGAAKARVEAAVSEFSAKTGKDYEEAQSQLTEDKKNKTVTVADLRGEFQKTVTAAITASFNVDDCVSAMQAPTAAYGKARFDLLAKTEGSKEQVTAQNVLDKAQADLVAALRRVEMLVSAAQGLVSSTYQDWAAYFGKTNTFEMKSLPPPRKSDSLKDMCKQPAS